VATDLLCSSRCCSCYHRTGEIVPIAQPERGNHSGITSIVCFELLSRGPIMIFHSTDGVRPEGHQSVSLQKHVSPQDVHARLEAQFGDGIYSEWSVGRGASMFGKDTKTCMPRCNPAGHQLVFLTSEFWHCWMNGLSFGLFGC
jgi:hypothetical protein